MRPWEVRGTAKSVLVRLESDTGRVVERKLSHAEAWSLAWAVVAELEAHVDQAVAYPEAVAASEKKQEIEKFFRESA